MGFDAMASDASVVPAIAREMGKKKRANRSAKLKQCKLDARREQWLSQVKNKGCKDTTMATSPTSPPQQISESRSTERERRRCREDADANLEHDGSILQDSSDAESPTHHPSGSPLRKNSPTNNSISSSVSSIGSCSRSVSDAEEDDEEETGEKGGGGLDDWEAVADALSVSSDNGQDHHPKSSDSVTADDAAYSTTATTIASEPIKREPDRTVPRAWMPDDVFRPQSLPNLSKQRSFPVNLERQYNAHHNHHGLLSPPPSSCPICYEDLDLTDSSFLPCSCGFRLCLFCHKRILEADGRCPGCRMQYSPARPHTPPTYLSYSHHPANPETFAYATVAQSSGNHPDAVPFGYGSSGSTASIPSQTQQQAGSQTSFALPPANASGYMSTSPYAPQSNIQGYNAVYSVDGSRVQTYQPVSYALPSNIQGMQTHQLPPNSNSVFRQPGTQLMCTHPYADMIEKAASMGFPRDHVAGVVDRMAESGQPVDFNALLDRLNSRPAPAGPPRAWSG